MSVVEKAYQFAKEKHDKTGKQYNGQPYITHPVQVYEILNLLFPKDKNLLASAYLHDTLEDTDTTAEELQKEFNGDIVSLVKQVTKDENKDFPNITTARGLMLKVADRMANVSNLDKSTDFKKREKLFRKYSFCFIHEGTHLKGGSLKNDNH